MTKFRKLGLFTTLVTFAGIINIVPANAATGNITTTRASATLRTHVLQAVTNVVSIQAAGTGALAASATAFVATVSGPTGSTATPTWTAGSLGAAFTTGATDARYKMAYSGNTAALTLNGVGGGNLDAAAQAVGVVNFTPDVPGSYTITVATGNIGSGDEADITFTVYAENTSTTVGVACTTAYIVSSCTQVVGGSVLATLSGNIGTDATGGVIYTISSTGVGTIGSVTASTETALTTADGYTAAARYLVGTTTAATYPTTSLDVKTADTTAGTENEGVQGFDLVLVATTAGTQTITVTKKDSNGTPIATYTKSLTWIAASATGMNAGNTSFVIVTGDCPTLSGANASADAATLALTQVSRAYRGEKVNLCASARDVNNNAVVLATTSTFIFSLGGTIAANTGANYGATNGTSASKTDYDLTTGAVATGAGTVTAILIDIYGNVVTKTAPLSVYGSLATLSLANVGYAAAYAGSTTTTGSDTDTLPASWTGGAGAPGASTSAFGLLAVVAKDASGNVIDLAATNQGNSVSSFTIDSSATAGAPVAGTSDSAGATVVMSTGAAGVDISAAAFGSNVAVVNCKESSKAEKLTIAVRGLDSLGNRVTSNTVDFYCSDVASTVKVVTGATSVAAGGTTTIDVVVADAGGFPVADGTSVSIVANNGAGVSVSSKTTSNGKFSATSLPQLLAGAKGPIAISATAGTKSGTGTVAVTGGSTNIATQIDALNAKIVALNALIAKIMKKLGVK